MTAPTNIAELQALEILDSRGNPTVEAKIILHNGVSACAAVPSGASTGKLEAVEKRDGTSRYDGKGVTQAIASINNDIAKIICGKDANNQDDIDQLLISADGSNNKSNFGANAILAVSLGVQKAAAKAAGMPLHEKIATSNSDGITLPVPLMNIINGGAHAANNLDIQEFMIVPHGFDTFAEALRGGVETFHALRKQLEKAELPTAVGDEGGFAPNISGGTKAALNMLVAAIERAGYRPGENISIALDCAASEFYKDGAYHMAADNFIGDANALINMLAEWVSSYPIVSIEDACDENDWDGWRLLTKRLGEHAQLVGDDLFVTNPAVIQKGINTQTANALLVKPNQIGTISETRQAVQIAQTANYQTIMSHRSGETEYADIAELAVGFGCQQIKTGAPCRSERTAKYNQLLRIAAQTKNCVKYARNIYNRK